MLRKGSQLLMKRVLYLDLLSPLGHINLNVSLIEMMSQLASIDVCCKEDYLSDKINKYTKRRYNIPSGYYTHSSKSDYRLKNIWIIMWVLRNVPLLSYDIVFVSSYETISFSIAWPTIPSTRTIVLHHNNLDELASKVKRFFFSRLVRKVEHMVLEEHMKDYLMKQVVPHKSVWLVHHPMPSGCPASYPSVPLISVTKDKGLAFAPSSSNDEHFVEHLVELRRTGRFLERSSTRLVVKSKRVQFRDDRLIVVPGYLPSSEYTRLFQSAKIIILPYQQSFQHRTSGVLIECLYYGKPFLGTDIPLIRNYIARYPGIGAIFRDAYHLDYLLSQIGDVPEHDFSEARHDHSNDIILRELTAMLY